MLLQLPIYAIRPDMQAHCNFLWIRHTNYLKIMIILLDIWHWEDGCDVSTCWLWTRHLCWGWSCLHGHVEGHQSWNGKFSIKQILKVMWNCDRLVRNTEFSTLRCTARIVPSSTASSAPTRTPWRTCPSSTSCWPWAGSPIPAWLRLGPGSGSLGGSPMLLATALEIRRREWEEPLDTSGFLPCWGQQSTLPSNIFNPWTIYFPIHTQNQNAIYYSSNGCILHNFIRCAKCEQFCQFIIYVEFRSYLILILLSCFRILYFYYG